MVRGLVIVGMTIRVIPYNRYTHAREGAVVTTSDRVVPRPIIGCQIEVIGCDLLFQPIAKLRLCLGIEINYMVRLRLVVVAADHIEVEVALHLLHACEGLHERFRAKQALLLAIPERKEDGALRLLTGCHESPCDLQYGRDT